MRCINFKFKMNFKPLQDRILIERIEQEERTKKGIIIPDTAKEKPMEGVVVEIGIGLRNEEGKLKKMEVKKGDRVLFSKWGGTEVKLDNKDYLVLKESDIIGIIT